MFRCHLPIQLCLHLESKNLCCLPFCFYTETWALCCEADFVPLNCLPSACLKSIVTTKFSNGISGWLFQQNMAMAMALALVREARTTFPAITKGRKKISQTKLNITGNRGWQLDSLESTLHKVQWKLAPARWQLAHRRSVPHGHQSPSPPWIRHFILIFMNEIS